MCMSADIRVFNYRKGLETMQESIARELKLELYLVTLILLFTC